MLLNELFDDQAPHDMVQRLRNDLMDVLMPLTANGLPYVTIQAVIDKMRQRRSGIEVDRPLIMTVLDPDQVKMVSKIEGDKIYFAGPGEEGSEVRDAGPSQEELDKQHVQDTAIDQAKKEIIKKNNPAPASAKPDAGDGPL